jgi:hypothetical protein
LIVVALSWWLTIVLTPPNKPVENGLEVAFPGLLISMFAFPSLATAAGLIKGEAKPACSSVSVDLIFASLITALAISSTAWWLIFAALPLVLDAVLLVACVRKS